MSWSSRWMAFLLKATDGNMRNYIIWCGLTTAPAKGRTKGHDRREEAKRHNCSTFATATATKGNKNNSWLPFVSEFHFIIAFIATFLKGGGGQPLMSCCPPATPAVCPLLCLSCCRCCCCCRVCCCFWPTKKIQLKRNNIALHHQSCPAEWDEKVDEEFPGWLAAIGQLVGHVLAEP